MLCIKPDGTITAWLNTASGLQDVGQIKAAEGVDRADIRLADVNDSGMADLIYLDKYTGAGTVFQNLGHKSGSESGSSFSWKNLGALYPAVDRSENIVSPVNFLTLGGTHS